MMTKLTLDIVGTRPLITNNVRLRNPLDPYASKLKELSSRGTRGETDEIRIEKMLIEARGSCYETSDGLIGLPLESVWRCLYDASKNFRSGPKVKKALRATPDVVPMFLGPDAITISADDFINQSHESQLSPSGPNLFYRSAKPPGQGLVMRSRPIFYEWRAQAVLELDDSVIDKRDLAPMIEYAGAYVGLGNWRPTYGTFTTDIS